MPFAQAITQNTLALRQQAMMPLITHITFRLTVWLCCRWFSENPLVFPLTSFQALTSLCSMLSHRVQGHIDPNLPRDLQQTPWHSTTPPQSSDRHESRRICFLLKESKHIVALIQHKVSISFKCFNAVLENITVLLIYRLKF